MPATGGAYAAAGSLPYTPGTSYHFRVVVNMSAHTYSAYVTPKGGTEQTVATNYAFRAEQAGASSLGDLAIMAEVGTHSVTNVTVGSCLTVAVGADQSIVLPATATLDGTVTVNGSSTAPAGTTVTWTKTSGPGTVSFANAYVQDTTASFSAAGTYQPPVDRQLQRPVRQ